MQAEYEEADWIKASEVAGDDGGSDDDEDHEDEDDGFYCVVCEKRFKSDKQLKNHERCGTVTVCTAWPAWYSTAVVQLYGCHCHAQSGRAWPACMHTCMVACMPDTHSACSAPLCPCPCTLRPLCFIYNTCKP